VTSHIVRRVYRPMREAPRTGEAILILSGAQERQAEWCAERGCFVSVIDADRPVEKRARVDGGKWRALPQPPAPHHQRLDTAS
jgi:hypothetical protein